MARKKTKNPERNEPRTTGEDTTQQQPARIPKAKHLGGNTYVIATGTRTARKPIPNKHRKTKTS
jgi:hypothetical protein